MDARTQAVVLSVAVVTSFSCKRLGVGAAVKDEAEPTAESGRHVFKIQAKGFIARVTKVGKLPSLTGHDVLLKAFVKATNLNFNENPPDGERSSENYRLWAQVELTASCVGGKLTSFEMTSKDTDAGFEPSSRRLRRVALRAGTDKLVARADKNGRFFFQASGRPPIQAEPAFQAVARRVSNTIWYTVEGQVVCKPSNDAELVLDRNSVRVTSFPTTRLWVGKTSTEPFGSYQSKLLYEWPQGDFADLWRLPEVPGDVPNWGLGLAGGDNVPSPPALDAGPSDDATSSPEKTCDLFFPRSYESELQNLGFVSADDPYEWDVADLEADRKACVDDLKGTSAAQGKGSNTAEPATGARAPSKSTDIPPSPDGGAEMPAAGETGDAAESDAP